MIETKPSTEEDIYPNYSHCFKLSQWLAEVKLDMLQLPGHREDVKLFKESLGLKPDEKAFVDTITVIDLLHTHQVTPVFGITVGSR